PGWLPDNLVLSLSPFLVVLACLTGTAAGWLVHKPLNRALGTLFRLFNAGFNVATHAYTRAVGGLLRVSVLVLLVYGGLLVLTYLGFVYVPKGFIPSQD